MNGKGHQVTKFSPDGKVLLKLGTAGVKGNPPQALDAPIAVVTAPNRTATSSSPRAMRERTRA